MKKSITFLSSILLVVLCFSASVFAQQTTGELQGTVKDPAGAVVPNASVSIRGVDVAYNQTFQTNEEGFFRARQLPPGTYTVTVAPISGFAQLVKENVQVALDNLTTLDLGLGAAGASADVTVTADAGVQVDATEVKAQDNISAREIDALPKGTGFTSLLRTTAAVRPEPLSGQFSINGATGPENSFIVDGQETQNFRTGVLNGNNDIPFQAVQEIQVKTSGFEAEFGGATGGVINAVTKSGTNQFRGEFGMQFATSKLNAGPRPILSTYLGSAPVSGPGAVVGSGQGVEYFQPTKDPALVTFPSATLGGPVIKDRLWFYGIYAPRTLTLSRATNFIQGFGTGGGTQAIPCLAPGCGFSAAGGTSFNVATAGARVPVVLSSAVPAFNGASTTQTARFKRTFEYMQGRLDASPVNSLRLSSSYTWNPIVDRGNILSGAVPSVGNLSTSGGVPLLSTPGFAVLGNGQTYQGADLAAQQGGRQNSNNFRFEANWTPTSKLVTTLRYTRGFLNEKLGSYGVSPTTRIRCRSAAGTGNSANAGCLTGFQTASSNNIILKDVSIRNTVDANASYLVDNFIGRHEFKGGYQFSRILNDVNSGTAGQGGITHLYYNRTTLTPSFVCNAWSPTTTIPQPTLPTGVTVIGVGCNQRFSTIGQATNTAHTLFIQDKWQPTSRLTFNLGLRTENEKIPAFNDTPTNLEFGFKDKLAPRLGVAYALTGDGKTKISAFYGRFFDRLKFELPRGSFGGDYYHVDYFFITSDRPNYSYYTAANILGNYNPPIGGQCPAGGIAQSSTTLVRCDQDYRIPSNLPNSTALGGGAVDPNLKPYRQSEATVEFQRELMRASVLTVRGLYRHLDQAIEDAGVVNAQGSEAYIIGNPGQGLHLQTLQAAGYRNSIKPIRNYKALQLEYDTRFIRNFNFNVNYTLSRLYGNYSGLASPEEAGRTSPGVNRYFDLPFVGFTASGQPDTGILPLDRTHVFKASGTYNFGWFGSKTNSTDVSFFTTAQSGTPQTTFVDVFGIEIPETRRGDLGRTPTFTQTDLNFTHRYRFGRDERFTLAFDFNVINIFNENNVLGLQTSKSSGYYALSYEEVVASGDPVAAVNRLTNGGIINILRASEASFDPFGNNAAPNSVFYGTPAATSASYKLPNIFQDPRAIRFGFRLLF